MSTYLSCGGKILIDSVAVNFHNTSETFLFLSHEISRSGNVKLYVLVFNAYVIPVGI